MHTQRNRIALVLGTMLATIGLTPSAHAADGVLLGYDDATVAMTDEEEIPARLSNEPREDEPDGTCSMCTVKHLVPEGNSSGSSSAILVLYFEDNGQDELADLYVRVLLLDGSYRSITVPSIEFFDGQQHTFELSTDADWSWGDVRYAWVEIL